MLPRALAELVEGGLELGEADNRWGLGSTAQCAHGPPPSVPRQGLGGEGQRCDSMSAPHAGLAVSSPATPDAPSPLPPPRLFSRQSSGRGSGTIGRLSNGVLDRTEFHVDAVVCCLVPFLQVGWAGVVWGGREGQERRVTASTCTCTCT